MEDFARRISIQAEGTNNVLVIELQEGEQLVPYCCKIMESNTIPGLLRMRHQSMDGTVRLRYNIGGKVPLREFMVRNHLTHQNGILLLRNLSSALLHLNEYFLAVDMCYLDPEQLYVGDGLQVYLPCIPLQRESSRNTSARLKAFYEKLLSEYFATADCNSYDDMFKWVYKATLFDLETFYNQFLKNDPAKKQEPAQPVASAPAPVPPRADPPAPPAPPVPSAPPAPPAQPSVQEKGAGLMGMVQDKVKGVVQNYLDQQQEPPAKDPAALKERVVKGTGGVAFAIPGAPGPAEESGWAPPADKPAVEKGGKEKKGFWPFGGRADKKEGGSEPIPPRMPAQMPPAPPETPPMPPETPPMPMRQPPVQAKAPAPEPNDQWDDGTILVDAGSSAPVAPAQASAPQGASFVHQGRQVPITQTPFLVGKANNSVPLHYAIYDNNRVSRSHATFLCENGRYFIRDNQSRNGTFLNGKPLLPLQPMELKDGDEIRLYDEVLLFHLG